MTCQETFNMVATHLLTQGRRSKSTRGCRYRYYDDFTQTMLKCSGGCLIPDDQYSSSMEGHHVLYSSVANVLEQCGHDLTMVLNLQDIHDRFPVGEWVFRLKDYAIKMGLNTDVIDNFKKGA